MAINKSKLASAVLGLGQGGGDLQKLTITYEKNQRHNYAGSIRAMFNPNELGFTRTVEWEQVQRAAANAPVAAARQLFVVSNPQELSLELFFDTYESRPDKLSLGHLKAAVLPANPLLGAPEATDVRDHIKALIALATVDRELHRPPRCKLNWGTHQIFSGVLTKLDYTYTMFMPDGMPVRATATCSFIEDLAGMYAVRQAELHSPDVAKSRLVRRNETLQSIAADEYGDPRLWREIARANGIVNPRAVQPGMVLKIPKL